MQRNGEIQKCCGRVSTQKNKSLVILLILSILIGVALFYSTVVLFSLTLEENLVNSTSENLDNESYVFSGIVGIITISVYLNYFNAAFNDPGIVKKVTLEPIVHKSKNSRTESQLLGRRPPRKQIILGGNKKHTYGHYIGYCDTCNSFIPPKTEHCTLCHNCVLDFDHHCPYLGNCVGKRNYSYFISFLSSVFLLELSCLIFSIMVINQLVKQFNDENGSEEEKAKIFLKIIFSVLMIVYAFIASIFSWPLFFFHLSLISKSETTYTSFQQKKSKPRGVYNLFKLCCRSKPTSMILDM